MMQALGTGLVLPPGSVPAVALSGEEHEIKILSYHGWEAWVQYPDGFTKHHQVFTVNDLLDKIAGQLKTRYNILSFEFKAIPQALEQGLVKIGGIKYA